MSSLGIIIADFHENCLIGPLTLFAGSYSLLDFSVSTMINSGADTVVILTSETHSGIERYINGHEANGAADIRVVVPHGYSYGTKCRSCFFDCIQNADRYINEYKRDRVFISSGNTVVNTSLESFEPNDGALRLTKSLNKLPVFALNRDTYIFYSKKGGLAELLGNTLTRECETYAADILDENDLFSANIEIAENRLKAKELFEHPYYKIYSKSLNAPPAKFGEFADARRVIAADGCVINGEVITSVVFPYAVVEEGAYAKNCLIMPYARLKKGEHHVGRIIK